VYAGFPPLNTLVQRGCKYNYRKSEMKIQISLDPLVPLTHTSQIGVVFDSGGTSLNQESITTDSDLCENTPQTVVL